MLSLKHPEVQQAHHKAILQGPKRQIHSTVYEDNDENLVKKVAIKTKGGCGPPGLDTDNWFIILVSNKFSSSPLDLQTSTANFVRRLCNTNIHFSNSGTDNSLEAFTASRLIPLNKNPGVCPICGIDRKVIMYIAKKDAKDAAESLQVCAGQEAGLETANHGIYVVYQQGETEAILLVDANNAFNSINRKAMLHNISITCPPITTFIANCYQTSQIIYRRKSRNKNHGKVQHKETQHYYY